MPTTVRGREEGPAAVTGAVAVAVIVVDRIAKVLVSAALPEGRSVPVIPGIFHLTLVHNRGIAFGLFRETLPLAAAITFAAAALVLAWYVARSVRTTRAYVSCGLILGGAAGNIIDRIRFGYVIDLLDLRVWPVFNIADSAITIGMILLAFSVIRGAASPLRRG